MFFSPVTSRSLRVRLLYGALYVILTLLASTMLLPFMVMISGSTEPGTYNSRVSILPAYLFDKEALWKRYIFAKYREQHSNLQMSWSDPTLDARNAPTPPAERPGMMALWQEFRKTEPKDGIRTAAGFSAAGANVPTYYSRLFQKWLAEKYESVAALNAALGTQFPSFNRTNPPPVSLIGPELGESALLQAFTEFTEETVPEEERFYWNAGGYFRAIYLPRLLGHKIEVYNQRYGTQHSSYRAIPFPSSAPQEAVDLWFEFVAKLMRPDFVGFTPKGEQRFRESGLKRVEFIRNHATVDDLKVLTTDCQFQDWALEHHGQADARIPAGEMDRIAFEKSGASWKWRFLLQNYLFVIDEIMLHGNALKNTLILVLLSVVGALTVNPLAAYALSRFKLRKTYFLLLFFLATIAFPSEVTMIPVFLQLKQLGLLNSFGALVLPTLANGFSIFLLKGFFDSLPKELYEAAELDGASEWRMFWLIAMNLSKPILAVIGLGAFVSAYGAFFYALILAPDPGMWTIMVYIYQLQQNAGSSVVYASLIVTAIPTLLIFIFCQNLILRGIVVPSEK